MFCALAALLVASVSLVANGWRERASLVSATLRAMYAAQAGEMIGASAADEGLPLPASFTRSLNNCTLVISLTRLANGKVQIHTVATTRLNVAYSILAAYGTADHKFRNWVERRTS